MTTRALFFYDLCSRQCSYPNTCRFMDGKEGVFDVSISTLPVDPIPVLGGCIELDLDLGTDLSSGDIDEGDLPIDDGSVDRNVVLAYLISPLGNGHDGRIPLVGHLDRDSLQPIASSILDCAINVAADGIIRVGSRGTGQPVLVN